MFRSLWCSSVLLTLVCLTGCADDTPGAEATCGNGLQEGAESCDDGNPSPGDGCSAACSTEPGWVCAFEGLPCATRCGDQVVAGAEACDDGNTDNGDGCSSVCAEEPGGPVEVCDDGIDNDGDRLIDCEDADCAESCQGDEICDDGVDNDDDALTDCDDPDCASASACASREENCSEPGDEDGNGLADCDDTEACECSCGDGEVNGSEQCDDGDANSDTEPNACRSTCSTPSCGDGVVDTGELCDGGEPPVGFVCNACLLAPVPVCGESDSLASWSISSTAPESLTRRFGLDSSRADDVAVPESCLPVQGADAIVPISFVEGGVYRFTFSTPDPGTRVAALFSSTCDFTSAPCERASTGLDGSLVVASSGADAAYLSLDSGSQASVTVDIRVTRFERALAEGEVCDASSTTEVCSSGLICSRDVSGNSTCTRGRTLSGQGGACSIAADCVPGLECRERVCEPFLGTTCESVLPFDEVDRGEPVTVALEPSLGSVVGTCGGFPNVSLFNVEISGYVTITASSPLGLPVALSIRELCDFPISETLCVTDDTGASTALSFESPSDATRTLVVESFGEVVLNVVRVPLRSNGQRCDEAGVADRCESGLSCTGGVCEPALAGSCADPAPAFLAGSGDLLGRGLVIQVEPSTVTSTTIPDCSGPVRTQVFTLTAPATGRLVAGVLLESPGVTLRLTQACLAESGTDTYCRDRGTNDVLNVRAGQDVQLMVSTLSNDDVLVNLQLQPTSPEFGPCADATGCEDGLICAGGTCARREVALNAPCSLITDRCPAAAVCAPDGTALRCLPNPASVGQICDTFAGLPLCSVGLVCEAGDAPTGICGEPGGSVGDACERDADCESRFVCLERECWPSPGAVGGGCRPESPQPCQAGSTCESSGAGSVCVADIASPCTSSRDCDSPFVCFGEFCRAPLGLGQTCGPTTLPCGAGLECDGLGVCIRALAGVDEFCAANSECRAGLFCRIAPGAPDGNCAEPRNEGEICLLGGDPVQCVAPLVCESDSSSIPRCTALP
jgi:cysteine-rich repeat protein